MVDSGIQHWEAEMEYIGDMLGTVDEQGSVDIESQQLDAAQAGEPGAGLDDEEAGAGIGLEELHETVEQGVSPPASTVSAEAIEQLKGDLYQLIDVAGIQLALPLESIAHVVDTQHPVDGDMLEYMGQSYHVIGLHELIRPGDDGASVGNYILLADRHIALACERVADMRSIDSREVCWRDENSKRGWLAGTIKQQGIALLELDALGEKN